MRRRFTLLELLVAVMLIATCATFLALSQRRVRETSCCRTKCPNQLRQLSLAALQYADDKRFLPHVGKLAALDGDVDTNHTTKVARALVWYGYHDNPEGWICPSSDDAYVPIDDEDVRANMRRWFWKGERRGSLRVAPFVDGAPDPALQDTAELSYGWTRKGMNASVRSSAVLGADRAIRAPGSGGASKPGRVGNHTDGWNVVKADGTVEFISRGYDPDGTGKRVGARWLRGTGKNDGCLAIADPRRSP